MRRPMVFIGVSLGTGMAAAFIWGPDKMLLLGMLFIVIIICVVSHGDKKRNVFLLFLGIFLLGAVLMRLDRDNKDPLEVKAGSRVEITGTISETKQKGDQIQLVVRHNNRDILVRYDQPKKDEEYLAGKRIAITGKAELPAEQRNPKCFDYRLYLESIGIRVIINADRIQVLGGKVTRIAGIRNHFQAKLLKTLPRDRASIVIGMLFGDKSMLDEDIYESFQRNGTAHILAVSGLHIGILYGFFCFVWRGKKGTIFYLLILSFLLFYMALASFSPSVVRATVMIILHIGAKILHRRYDLLSATAFTFILMVLIKPMELLHVGFQMSFLAIISLGVLLPFIKEAYSGIFLSGLAIQAGMGVYTANVFNYFSLASLLINIPVIFLAGILVPAGVILIGLSFLPGEIFSISAGVLDQGSRLMIFMNHMIFAGGKTSFDVVSPQPWVVWAYHGLLFFLLSEKGRILFVRRKWRRLFTGIAIIVLAAVVTADGLDDGFSEAQVVFVDVGQGDCLHIRTPEGKNYLIDGGGSINYDVGKKLLKPYLLKNGVRKIDIAFTTHLHTDHFAGLKALVKEGMVDRVALYEGNRPRFGSSENLLYLYKGQKIKLGTGIYIEVLYPQRKASEEYIAETSEDEDENKTSLIMKVTYNQTSIMMTGDIDEQGEAMLMEMNENLHADILKIAHHGSRYSTSEPFLNAVEPEIAVVQVGKNNFGHPARRVLELCRKNSIMVYRNDYAGAVGICGLDKNNDFYIKTMIK